MMRYILFAFALLSSISFFGQSSITEKDIIGNWKTENVKPFSENFRLKKLFEKSKDIFLDSKFELKKDGSFSASFQDNGSREYKTLNRLYKNVKWKSDLENKRTNKTIIYFFEKTDPKTPRMYAQFLIKKERENIQFIFQQYGIILEMKKE